MIRIAFVFAALCSHAALAVMVGWPTKPVRLIVPFPPGSSTDVAARTVTNKVSTSLGQQIVVDNRAGASGNIAAQTVANAVPDGYTFLLGTTTTHAIAVSAQRHLNYDPVKDFAPV